MFSLRYGFSARNGSLLYWRAGERDSKGEWKREEERGRERKRERLREAERERGREREGQRREREREEREREREKEGEEVERGSPVSLRRHQCGWKRPRDIETTHLRTHSSWSCACTPFRVRTKLCTRAKMCTQGLGLMV
jgi:hypothetical protein